MVGLRVALQGEGEGQEQLKLVSPLHKVQSQETRFSTPDGRGTLRLSSSLPSVAGDSGTITLHCKDLRVLQLDIEGVEATLDIARSIEVRRGAPEALKLPLSAPRGFDVGYCGCGLSIHGYPGADDRQRMQSGLEYVKKWELLRRG